MGRHRHGVEMQEGLLASGQLLEVLRRQHHPLVPGNGIRQVVCSRVVRYRHNSCQGFSGVLPTGPETSKPSLRRAT